MNISKIIGHARERDYMSGVDRDRARVKATGEVFTPTPLAQEVINGIPKEMFLDHTKTFLDNSCGDGQFLSEILIRKIENGSTFEQALSTIYGVDLMQDNVDECRTRLLCGREDLRHIVEKNIQCHDGLNYGYRFEPMGPARRKTEEARRKKSARLKATLTKKLEEETKRKDREKILKKFTSNK